MESLATADRGQLGPGQRPVPLLARPLITSCQDERGRYPDTCLLGNAAGLPEAPVPAPSRQSLSATGLSWQPDRGRQACLPGPRLGWPAAWGQSWGAPPPATQRASAGLKAPRPPVNSPQGCSSCPAPAPQGRLPAAPSPVSMAAPLPADKSAEVRGPQEGGPAPTQGLTVQAQLPGLLVRRLSSWPGSWDLATPPSPEMTEETCSCLVPQGLGRSPE